MFVQFWTTVSVFRRQPTTPFQRSFRAVLFFGTLTALVGCATPPRPFAGPDPSDPEVRVPAATYRTALSGYTSQRPVGPAPWRERNEPVAPAEKR